MLKRKEIEPFLKQMIMGNEKWFTYDNNVRKWSWPKAGEASQKVANPRSTPRKVMLSVWRGWKETVHHQLPKPDQAINLTLHCEELVKLKEAIQEKQRELIIRKCVVFHRNNATPHTSLMIRQRLRAWQRSFDGSIL